MKYNGVVQQIKLDYSASSMYSVIADGMYHATNAGSSQWKSLVSYHTTLQHNHCPKEGFNVAFPKTGTYLRFGLVENQGAQCDTLNSLIGFGMLVSECNSSRLIHSAANIVSCSNGNTRTKAFPTFGYIFVQ